MANKALVKKIREGWVLDQREQMGRADLRGADLRGADLSGADLLRADLVKADLRGANLRGAILVEADLNEADLSEAKLEGAGFTRAKLNRAKLIKVDLSEAHFFGLDLSQADLSGANLRAADFREADLHRARLPEAYLYMARLRRADLREADLSGVNLNGADLSEADLREADLSGAELQGANFWGAHLGQVDLTGATVGWTSFASVDLSDIKGLETVQHSGPSTIGVDTIYISKGKIPKAFLRGAGVGDRVIEFIEAQPERAWEGYSCFISYSSKNDAFAKRLYEDLLARGVRCWRAPEEMKPGAIFWETIVRSVREHDKLLLVLSEESMNSEWVKKEVDLALKREKAEKLEILLPVRIDGAVMNAETGWPAKIKLSRNIVDFTRWAEPDAYQEALNRLVGYLKPGGDSI